MVKYQELWNEENTNIRERYDLAIERIMEIPSTLSEEEMNRLEPLIEDTIETDRLMTGTSW